MPALSVNHTHDSQVQWLRLELEQHNVHLLSSLNSNRSHENGNDECTYCQVILRGRESVYEWITEYKMKDYELSEEFTGR